MGRTEKIEEQELGKMSNRALTDLIMALLHEVVIRHAVVVADTTAARLSPLHLHHCRLRPCHTAK
jgi:hypothetical protein